ncbi:MAG TPA: MFS transporter [Candidatus Aquicultor sp.]|jgi:EmrB/QacA subfamily drug resistance transporter
MKLITDSNRKWWALGTVSFALFMIVLDGNVVNLAIPKIIKDFNATLPQVEWVSNAYLLAFAIFLITFGRLGDMIGRKKMFGLGIITFTIGSMLCGIAADVTQLTIFRIIQGLGAASMMPATLSLISANFARKERGMAMGIWGSISGLAIVAGPILGGFMTDRGLGATINGLFGISQYWRYVFFINIPFGMLALLATFVAIKESRDAERTHRIDFGGIILSAISVFLLTFAFIEGQKYGWWHTNQIPKLLGMKLHFGSVSIIPALFALSVISAITFVLYERTVKVDPMMDVKLFKNWNFSAGNFSTAVVNFATMGAFFLLPLFLQSVLGYSALKTGMMLLPFAATVIFAAPLSGKLTDMIGGKWVVVSGMAVMAIGLYYIGRFALSTSFTDLIGPSIVLGLGMGMTNGPLSTITLLDIPPDEFGGASGITGTMRQIGAVMGIAILGAFLQSTMSANIEANINKIDGLPRAAKTEIVTMAKANDTQLGSDTSKEQQFRKLMQDQMKNIKPPAMPANAANLPPQKRVMIQQQMKAKQAEIQKAMAAKFKKLGHDIETASKQGFTDSINATLQYAALIALFATGTSLLFRNKRAVLPVRAMQETDELQNPVFKRKDDVEGVEEI